MNHFSSQFETPTENDSNVVSVASIRVAEKRDLLALTLCSTFSPLNAAADSHTSINSIVGFSYQAKAWMVRNTLTVGRRTKFP
ncbi:MAG: hypothetical protein ACC653_08690 [Gammaproteobacteria bacterium]